MIDREEHIRHTIYKKQAELREELKKTDQLSEYRRNQIDFELAGFNDLLRKMKERGWGTNE